MTSEKYVEMCEQLGEAPDPNKMPPTLEDFPIDVQQAILIYNKLGDRLIADIGYVGKDMSALSVLMDVYNIQERELFIETILILDQRMIEKSAEAMKRERDKLKSKNGK